MNLNKRKKGEADSEQCVAPANGQESTANGQAENAATDAELEQMATELEASRQQNLRLMADFDNFRKRVNRERGELIRRANEELVTDILPVLDHFGLALQQAGDPADSFVVGVRMVYEQLVAVLEKVGLAAIEAGGAPFDPAIHDAISYQPSDSVPEGEVILQSRCGYRLGDYVIRPATVVVSSGTGSHEAGTSAEPDAESDAAENANGD